MFMGCPNDACNNVFCRVEATQETIVECTEKLKQYSDIFLCQNQIRILNYTHDASKDKKCIKIDFKKMVKEDDSIFNFLFDIIDMANKKYDLTFLNHKYCLFFKNNRLSETELFIMQNFFKLLLNKYKLNANINLGLLLLRLFDVFERYEFLTDDNILNLCNIFINVYHYHHDTFYNNTTGCDYRKECLTKKILTWNDYIFIVKNFCDLLENHRDKCIRTSKTLEEILNILGILYFINEFIKIFPYKRFYMSEFCKNINFKEEFRYYKANTKSILSYTFILPLEIKAEFLRYEHSDTMKTSLQDAFFRSMFEGPKEPYLFITVARNTIYKDTLSLLREIDEIDLTKQIKITFKNEEGIDSGGIRKEYFQLISENILEDIDLFVDKSNVLWINGNADDERLEDYIIIGKIIGIALYNDVILNIPFPKLFFTKLLGKDVDYDDLNEIEPELYRSLNNLKLCTDEEIEQQELSFMVPYNNQNINLLETQELVSAENIDLFVDLYFDFIVNKAVDKQFSAIKNGFNKIIKPEMISFLQPNELEKIIVGTNSIDVQTIKKFTILNGYDAKDLVIKHFWDIFDDYSFENKKKLLQFVTGNDRIPVNGAERLKFVIMKNGCDTDRLPSSQTCFNTLLLPEYSTKEKMEIKLSKAITMTKGFFLL